MNFRYILQCHADDHNFNALFCAILLWMGFLLPNEALLAVFSTRQLKSHEMLWFSVPKPFHLYT